MPGCRIGLFSGVSPTPGEAEAVDFAGGAEKAALRHLAGCVSEARVWPLAGDTCSAGL